MPDDPLHYWQDLTNNYAQMSDGELLELAEKPEDLTEVAQQVLRVEIQKRNLDQAQPQPAPPLTRRNQAEIRMEPKSYRYQFADGESSPSDEPLEYSWKTTLCDCETKLQAVQLARALQREGIDSWIQASRTAGDITDLTYPRVLVAADQLEQAQAVADRPIPQDIVDDLNEELRTTPGEFQVPRCPKCGVPDPILCPAGETESDPDAKLSTNDWRNHWLCESCGAQWSETEASAYTAKAPPPLE